MKNKNGMKKLYTVEQLQDSQVILKKQPPKFIEYLLYAIAILIILGAVLITFLKVDISVEARASVEPSENLIVLKADSKAQVEEVYKKDGEEVSAGELILKLKSEEKEANAKVLTDTKVNLEKKKEELLRLRESINSGVNKLKDSDSIAFKDEYNSYVQNAMQMEYDAVEQEIGSNQLNAKLENLKATTLSNVGVKIIEVDDALKLKTSELESNKLLMETLEIKAPKKGKIKLEKTITKNNMVEVSEPILTLLPDENKNKVVLYVNPQDIKRLEKEKQLTIKFDTEQKITIKAKVTEISEIPTVLTIPSKDGKKEESVNLYEVRVDVLSGDEKLAYGMVGVADVRVGEETMWNYIKRKLFG